MRYKKDNNVGEHIWYLLIAIMYLICILTNCVYWYQGKITPVENNFYNTMLFGFLILIHEIRGER